MKLRFSIVTYRNKPPSEPRDCVFDGKGGVIGREGSEDVVMFLPDPTAVVSRKHARIDYRHGNYYLSDISRNGIFVPDTGERLELGAEYPIAEGERFTIGDYVIVAHLLADEHESQPVREYVSEPREVDADLSLQEHLEEGAQRPDWWTEIGSKSSVLSSRHAMSDVVQKPSRVEDMHLPPPTPSAGDAPLHEEEVKIPTDYVPILSLEEAFHHQQDKLVDTRPEKATLHSEKAQPSQPITVPLTDSVSKKGLDNTAVQALLQGLGVSDLDMPAERMPEMMCAIGEMLRAALEGIMEALRQRERFKYEHYIRGTLFDDNPLKFSATVDDAINWLLKPREKGYKVPPARAVEHAYEDILAHLVAIMSVTQSAMVGAGSLKRLKPEKLEQDWYTKVSSIEHLIPLKRKAKLWNLFCKNYEQVAREAEDAFEEEFQQRFARAYAEEINRFKEAIHEASGRHEQPPLPIEQQFKGK